LFRAVHRYRLITEEADEVGPFVSPRLTFNVGEVIGRRGGERFAILRVIEAPSEESFRGYLVVKMLSARAGG
jgi:hypothetical protein